MSVALQHKLDRIDLRILEQLQRNGRITYSALADKVGLSTTPCMERVKRLERERVIRGYGAQVDPRYLNAGLVVFVQMRLERKSKDAFRLFKQAAAKLDQVQECFLVSGNFDYLIKARVADMTEYREFLGETLLTLPGVQESTSYVVMEEVKDSQVISVNHADGR